MPGYIYGEEVDYEFVLLEDSDRHKLKQFTCGNVKLDKFIREDIIPYCNVYNEDGLIFKAEDKKSHKIIAIVSLAANGIVFKQTNYMKILPAIKIDVFAVDKEYQKMHFSRESERNPDPDNHFYLSDSIMGKVIRHCNDISENYALVNYILLYADKKAYRFYQRNLYSDFEVFMEKEQNMEINKNIPMYMKL